MHIVGGCAIQCGERWPLVGDTRLQETMGIMGYSSGKPCL